MRPTNLSFVMPDLDDLPANRDLLKAYMEGNGLLSIIIDFDDADDIRAQTAIVLATPDADIYEELRHTVLSSESDIIFEIDDPAVRRAEAIKLLVADKREINMTLIALRGIKIASLSKLARHIGAVESEINQALAKVSEMGGLDANNRTKVAM